MNSFARLSLVAVLLVFCAWTARAEEPTDVSMIRLLATPEKYQGKVIRIVGFLHVGFEDNGIYLYKEDYHQSLFANGLWVDLAAKTSADASKLNNSYVLMVGKFDATKTGHMGLWSGTLTDIQRLVPWNSRRETP